MQNSRRAPKGPATQGDGAAGSGAQGSGAGTLVTVMNIKKKLLNPFVLGAQGFIAGAILFWSTHPAESSAPPPASAQVPVVQQIAGI